MLLTAVVSHDRLAHLQRTLRSYVETVTVPHDIVVVDNASGPATRAWLAESDWVRENRITVLLLDRNGYPGYATNRAWRLAGPEHDILHRSDNDMIYLPHWSDVLMETFAAHPKWGQVSLRTDEEELHQDAVGGNSAIRRAVWDAGVRFTDEPWTEVAWEDGLFNMEVRQAGFKWGRVPRPCVVHAGGADKTDPYYIRTYAERGISGTLESI